MIWKVKPNLEMLNAFSKNTLVEHLGIEFINFGDDYLEAVMPVDYRTVQPYRILHGGASVCLAETIGSVASSICVDINTSSVVGVEINANHLRQAKEGNIVKGKVTPLKIGRKLHVWNIEITDENERLIAISRLTMAIIDKVK